MKSSLNASLLFILCSSALLLAGCVKSDKIGGSTKTSSSGTIERVEGKPLSKKFGMTRLLSRSRRKKKGKHTLTGKFKDYSASVSEQDKRDMKFVVSSAAEKSTVSLALSQGKILEALDRIQEIHPLTLLETLASDPSLVEGLEKMRGRDWVWNLFTEKLGEAFSMAASQGLLSSSNIESFSTTLGLDTKVVSDLVQGENWSGLLDAAMTAQKA
ncbi:hypothetical protein [Chlamydiifrater phoenicopteri]|uniref:hypothetical protein n=1 Tax=Chlamydiifrater phoenicopteri TaxID=2681469 RepID=UPI001FE43961|nr:hypothetical protein [Chlamydiifrater phoenicopteri]